MLAIPGQGDEPQTHGGKMSKDKVKWLLIGLALGIIGGGIGTAAGNKWFPGVTRFEKIEAREIVIRNDAGKRVVKLFASGNDGILAMENAAVGLPAVMLAASSGGGGGLIIHNAAGKPVVSLATSYNNDGLLNITNAAGTLVATLP